MANDKENVYIIPKDESGSPTNGDLLAAAAAVGITAADIAGRVTLAGDPLPINPETGEIDEEKLTDEQRAELAAAAKQFAEAAKGILTFYNDHAAEVTKGITNYINKLASTDFSGILNNLSPGIETAREFIDLKTFIEKELEREEYSGLTYSEIMRSYTPGELYDILHDPQQPITRAFEAARKARQLELMRSGKQARQQMKKNAEESGAIMRLQGNVASFSGEDLTEWLSPRRIAKLGKLPTDYITARGLINKYPLEEGDIETLNAGDISLKALLFLTAISRNTVDNIYKQPVKEGEIEFYVKGALEYYTNDPRYLLDNQLNLDRKTAGALYLEKEMKPLTGYIGQMPNGSRWSLLAYKGYNAERDTMTIETPYIYQCLLLTQERYFERQKNKAAAIEAGKKPKSANEDPIELNQFFKPSAINSVDEITLEIAIAITNQILQAGCKKGKSKKTKIKYSTLIKKCSRLNARLSDIAARPATEKTADGKIINNARAYNDELRKIKSAIELILNPDKSDFIRHYEIIDISPAKINKAGKIEFKPPTKKQLEDVMYIEYSRKNDD